MYPQQYYGTLRCEIERIWQSKRHAIFDVDVQGGINLKKTFGDKALSIFVMPPSIEVLEKRLRRRKTEGEEKIQMRLSKVQSELKTAKQFDKIIVNDNLEIALQESKRVVVEFLNMSK